MQCFLKTTQIVSAKSYEKTIQNIFTLAQTKKTNIMTFRVRAFYTSHQKKIYKREIAAQQERRYQLDKLACQIRH